MNKTSYCASEATAGIMVLNKYVYFLLLSLCSVIVSGCSRKKYLGGLAPHHLGGNNGYAKLLQNQFKILGAWARFGGLCPPGPSLKSPLVVVYINQQ